MNRDDYLKFHEAFCDEARALSERKNKDYCGAGGDDPFANFRRVEHLGVCTVEKGFLVRMTDKLSRLATFAGGGTFAVADEQVADTCLDLLNYTVLLAAYVESRRAKADPMLATSSVPAATLPPAPAGVTFPPGTRRAWMERAYNVCWAWDGDKLWFYRPPEGWAESVNAVGMLCSDKDIVEVAVPGSRS